jgi:hypothetical protein
MNEALQNHIRDIMAHLSCPKGFACSINGFAAISQTRPFLEDYFTCTGAKPECCPHSLHYGYFYYCLCPLLNCVAKELLKDRNAFELKPLRGKETVTANCL